MKNLFWLLLLVGIATAQVPDDAYLLQTLNTIVPLSEEVRQQAELLVENALAPKAPTHQDPCPLFDAYPGLRNTIAHISLTDVPTPIEKLKTGKFIGLTNFYIKRDDLTGKVQKNGVRAYGGNKPRKHEFLLADALEHGAKTVLTWGCVGSNFAVATAWYAKELGLETILMLMPEPNSHAVRTNLACMKGLGAHLYYCPNRTMRASGTTYAALRNKLDRGDFPYCMPTGGSNPRGATGFVNAIFELKAQIVAGVMPEPDFIFIPCSGNSGGTTAGMLVGLRAAGLKSKLIGVSIERMEQDKIKEKIYSLAQATSEFLHTADTNFPLMQFGGEDLTVIAQFAGPGYGTYTKEGVDTAQLIKRVENITLDGTYTAKTFAGMLAAQAQLPRTATVLYWHTYCSAESPELTKVGASDFPLAIGRYFTDPVQALDQA